MPVASRPPRFRDSPRSTPWKRASRAASTCHGQSGQGTNNGYFPRIAGKPAGYLYNQLVAFRDGTRQYPPMNYLVAYLPDPYLREMAEHFAKQRPPFEARDAAPADAAMLARGKAIATAGDPRKGIPPCIACHGSGLTGMEPGIPGLVGLRAPYIVGAAHALARRQPSRGRARLHEAHRVATVRSRYRGGRRVACAAGSARRPFARVVEPRSHAARVRQPAVSRRDRLRHRSSLVLAVAIVGDRRWRCVSGDAAAGHAAATRGHGAAAAPNPTTQFIVRGRISRARGRLRRVPHRSRTAASSPAGARWPTPFGNLYVPNITPDDETGIGQWTADEFYRMMHTGISRDGTLLYPAMPFASYTKVTREDCDAIYAYLMSVPPVKQQNRPHELRFPYNKRELLVGWRALYFKEGEYVPDPKQSAQWNRGAYLVEGLGHCSMCHTAINVLGGSSESQAFEGGMIPNQNWYAPSLTSNREAGLGDWSIKDIADLLQVGISNRGTVYGPMAEVVYNSLQYMTRRGHRGDGGVPQGAAAARFRAAADQPGAAREPEVMELGRKIYAKQCAMCHGGEGKGQPPHFPPLAGNQSITMAIAGQLDPHGAERRLSARHEEEPASARHAAVRAHPERRRSGRRS